MEPEAGSEAEGALEPSAAEVEREQIRYATLFELAPVPQLVTDSSGLIREANRAAAEMLAVDRRFLLGKPIALFSLDQAEFQRWTLELAHSPTAVKEAVLQPRGRRPLHVQVTARRLEATPLQGDILWGLTDVEWRVSGDDELRTLAAELERRVEDRTAELERERALLTAVVQRVPAPLVVVDAPTGGTLVANEEAERLLGDLAGAVADTARGDRWGDVRPIAEALDGKAVTREAVQLVGRGGRAITLEVNAAPIRDRSGVVVMAAAVLQDVTERERRERSEREFITNAAHELLTPLAAITSAVEVLQGGAKEDPEQRDRFLAHAERETARLGRLARALLVLARAQMGTEAPRGELVELAPLLDEIVSGLRPAPGVSVELDCPDELALVTNRELATQALVNIGANAAKFTQAGSIRFRARLEGDSFVVVDVSDSGPGIPGDVGAKVFDRFYRAPASREATEGFGLGLAIARQAVEALGGAIELRSGTGGGTAIAVTLPGARLAKP